jgi:hypothetical protein
MTKNYILTQDGYIDTDREIGWIRDGSLWKADYVEKLEWFFNVETCFYEQKYKQT